MSDIFDILGKIDNSDINYYNNLSKEEKKKISLFLLNRFLSGTKDGKQIISLNTYVNSKVFSFYNDQDLLYKLMCSISTGKKRYTWPVKKKSSTEDFKLKLISEYHSCTHRDAVDILKIITKDELVEIALNLNVEKDIIAKLKKE